MSLGKTVCMVELDGVVWLVVKTAVNSLVVDIVIKKTEKIFDTPEEAYDYAYNLGLGVQK